MRRGWRLGPGGVRAAGTGRRGRRGGAGGPPPGTCRSGRRGLPGSRSHTRSIGRFLCLGVKLVVRLIIFKEKCTKAEKSIKYANS